MNVKSFLWGLFVLVFVVPVARGAVPTYIVAGHLDWTDAQGNLHNMRKVKVEIWVGTTLRGTTNADLDGNYVLTFLDNGAGSTSFIRAYAETPSAFVSFDYTPAATWFVQSGSVALNAGSIDTINYTANNTGVIGQSFSVVDAMVTGDQYFDDLRNSVVPKVPIKFYGSGDSSSFDPILKRINILGDHAYDWDVLGHEYSHDVLQADKLDTNPGGKHFLGTSNIPTRGKSLGTRVAWGEGAADYLGVAQHIYKTAEFQHPTNLANVGDTFYQDTRINQTITLNLEGNAGSGVAGEGEEVGIARILWDLADPKNESWDRVERGQMQLYQDFKNAATANGGTLETLSQFNNHLLNSVAANDKERTDIGAIFEKYSMSPHPTGDLIGSERAQYDSPPRFDWERQNNNASDRFELIIWNGDLSQRLLDYIIPGDVINYTLTQEQWDLIRATGGTKMFAILGSDLLANDNTAYVGLEQTGSYWSDAYSFSVFVPEPVLAAFAALPVLLSRRVRRKKRTPRSFDLGVQFNAGSDLLSR